MSQDGSGLLVPAHAEARLVQFDMFEDGRHVANWTLAGANHASMFPPLPQGRAEAVDGWSRADADRPDSVYYSVAGFSPVDPSTLFLHSRMDGLCCDLTETVRSEVMLFDTAAGTYRGMEGWWYEGVSWGDTAFARLELVSVETLPSCELAAMSHDAGEYFRALGSWHRLTEEAHELHVVDSGKLAKAEGVFQEASVRISDSLLRSVLERGVAELRSQLEAESRHACWEHPLVGKAAPEWELQDLAGDVHRLGDYRGRAVVLSFWSRECCHSLLALHMLNGLAGMWDVDQVVVLGMHLRPSRDDALLVRDRLGVGLPMLQAAGHAKEYSVSTHRSVYVVDRRGVVRAVLKGDVRSIEAELPKVLASLLD